MEHSFLYVVGLNLIQFRKKSAEKRGMIMNPDKDKKNRIFVDGKSIETTTREFDTFTRVGVEVGTNGLQGGDSGHGSRTYIRLFDTGGGYKLDFRIKKGKYDNDDLIITAGGDDELQTLAEIFRFIADNLEVKIKEGKA
jgi:hypothetical protein